MNSTSFKKTNKLVTLCSFWKSTNFILKTSSSSIVDSLYIKLEIMRKSTWLKEWKRLTASISKTLVNLEKFLCLNFWCKNMRTTIRTICIWTRFHNYRTITTYYKVMCGCGINMSLPFTKFSLLTISKRVSQLKLMKYY